MKYGSFSISFQFIFILFRLARKARLVNVHVPFPIVFEVCAKFYGKKLLLTTYHADIVARGLLSTFFFSVSQNLALKMSKSVIFTSDFYKNRYSKVDRQDVFKNNFWLEKPAKKIHISANRFKIPEKYILYIGRFGRYKGLSVL